jgi:hypothetical protein
MYGPRPEVADALGELLQCDPGTISMDGFTVQGTGVGEVLVQVSLIKRVPSEDADHLARVLAGDVGELPEGELRPGQFPPAYRLRMLQAYPVIAGLTADELYTSTQGQRDRAFRRILASRHLQDTHRMYLRDHGPLVP